MSQIFKFLKRAIPTRERLPVMSTQVPPIVPPPGPGIHSSAARPASPVTLVPCVSRSVANRLLSCRVDAPPHLPPLSLKYRCSWGIKRGHVNKLDLSPFDSPTLWILRSPIASGHSGAKKPMPEKLENSDRSCIPSLTSFPSFQSHFLFSSYSKRTSMHANWTARP
jgi:hypothetical protein